MHEIAQTIADLQTRIEELTTMLTERGQEVYQLRVDNRTLTTERDEYFADWARLSQDEGKKDREIERLCQHNERLEQALTRIRDRVQSVPIKERETDEVVVLEIAEEALESLSGSFIEAWRQLEDNRALCGGSPPRHGGTATAAAGPELTGPLQEGMEENEQIIELEHAIEHALTCSDTKLCPECERLLRGVHWAFREKTDAPEL